MHKKSKSKLVWGLLMICIVLAGVICILGYFCLDIRDENAYLKLQELQLQKQIQELQEQLEEKQQILGQKEMGEKNQEENAVIGPPKSESLFSVNKELAAGTILDKSSVIGNIDLYFGAFEIAEGDEIYNRIYGKSYRDNDNINLENLRYLKLLHYNFEHKIQVGEMIVNVSICEDILHIFKELFNEEYEIQSIYLIDNYWTGDAVSTDTASIEANNTSCFNYREVTGGSVLSRHAYGCAVDINPQQNPYVWYEGGEACWTHENATPYINRDNKNDSHIITAGDLCYSIFEKYGFAWGGNWTNPVDYQHFEKKNEEIAENVIETDLPIDSREMQVEEYIETLTINEKVAQLFIILPEALVNVDCVTAAGEMTKQAFEQFPVGGFTYLENNLISSEQVREMLTNIQSYSMGRLGLPVFTCVDEEGGTVTRISGREEFSVPYIGNMSELGALQTTEDAFHVGKTIGEYLSILGFNVDFAPVADVLSNQENQVVRFRSFGNNPEVVSDMSVAVFKGLKENGVLATFKHFPGHGATEGDTHEGYAYTEKSLAEMEKCELVPFQDGINQGVKLIMIGHISLPNIIQDNTPASLSEVMMKQILREKMGYDGIIITDAMNMGAIVQQYSSSEAAVNALLAGADIVLMPEDFFEAYYGVLDAVENGVLSQDRINESLRRILKVKLELKDKIK